MHPTDILEIYRAKTLRQMFPLGDISVKEEYDHYRGSDYKLKKVYPKYINDDSLALTQHHFECRICKASDNYDNRFVFDKLRGIRIHYAMSHKYLVKEIIIRKKMHHYDTNKERRISANAV